MHRLTRIKQLAHSYLVYPSAVHTRFEHSLGILHIADRMCSCFNIDNERREVIRSAALLHDVGHGPFSHLFEDVLTRINGKDFDHEDITKAIIQDDNQISAILKGDIQGEQKLPDIHSKILNIFDKKAQVSDVVAKFIISSQLDADKMDYLRRDSYHTGSTYGIFDLERILSTLRLASEIPGKEVPVILEKGIPALESFRLARYSLYTQVYQHHARLCADQMFLRALELAIFKEKKIPQKRFKFKGREKEFLEDYLQYDDSSIYELVLNKCQNNHDSFAFQIMSDLKNRQLFKRAYEKDLDEMSITKIMEFEKDPSAIEKAEKEIAGSAGVSPELIIVYVQSEEPGFKGYSSFSKTLRSKEFPFLYLDKDGKIRSAEDRFSITTKGDPPKKIYIFTKPIHRESVSKACKSYFSN